MGELGGVKGGEASVGIYYMRRIKMNKPTNQNSLLAFPAENKGRSWNCCLQDPGGKLHVQFLFPAPIITLLYALVCYIVFLLSLLILTQ